MSTIPQEALDAAAARLAAIDGKGAADPEHIRVASLILLDAAPHIRADEREVIAQLAERRDATYRQKPGGSPESFAARVRRIT